MPDKLGTKGLLSDDKRSVAVFEENRMEYRGVNEEGKRILRYKIDGGMIIDNTSKCDNALYLPDSKVVYFIELKGANLQKAADQIYQTVVALSESLVGVVIHARAICSKIQTPSIRSSQIIRLERELSKTKGSFKKSCRQFIENI
jgi:hypothetical protein